MTVMLVVGAFCPSSNVQARTETVRQQTAHVDGQGMWIETVAAEGPSAAARPNAGPRGSEIIWHMTDPASITASVCVADTTDETWVGHNLNNRRLSYLQTTGDGTPIWEYYVEAEDPDKVAVASAEDVSLGILMVQKPGATGVNIRAFNGPNGPTPIWTYNFDYPSYRITTLRNVDASADGSIVGGVASFSSTGNNTMVVILDGTNGGVLNSLPNLPFVSAIELSDDGSRAVLSEGSTVRVIRTSDMATIHLFSLSATNGYHRLSRDGKVVAAGGFDFEAYRETNGVWTQVYYLSEPYQIFGAGIALSEQGDTLFLASYTYTNYLDLTYRVIDLLAGVELARTTTSGTGSNQDVIQVAQASGDGQVFAVVSWGTEDNAHPEVQVFDRDAQLIGSIDTPGSPFDMDLTRDGQYVVAGGKHVHANTMGNGSDTYAYGVAVSPPIPTVYEWGLIGMMLCLLTAGTLVLGRRRHAKPFPRVSADPPG